MSSSYLTLNSNQPLTHLVLLAMKQRSEKITCLTAYDASFAALIDTTGIEVILVGDSLGMVIQGHDSTLPVTIEQMAYHTAAVKKGEVVRAVIVRTSHPIRRTDGSILRFDKTAMVIIDKDNAPKWDPPNLAGVSQRTLDEIFAPLGEGELTFD